MAGVLAFSHGPFKSTRRQAAVSSPYRQTHRHVSTIPSVEPLWAEELRPWGSAR
jgi:hypothetical protein